jgi:DNA-binding NarL/FixJ family response regulator
MSRCATGSAGGRGGLPAQGHAPARLCGRGPHGRGRERDALGPTITKRLLSAFVDRGGSRAEEARRRLDALTERERQVILGVGRGLSNAEIGRELAMSEAAVKAHVSRCLAKLDLAKLDLANHVQAAILVHDAGLL